MKDDEPPAPPLDLAARNLRAQTIAAGTSIHRVHETRFGAIFFGHAARWRFDDPVGVYGTMYAGLTPEAAFVETMLRTSRFVAESELALRSFSAIEVAVDLRLAPLHGPSLIAIGATAAVSAGPYTNARSWSRAIHEHPDHVDGIIYRSTRDNAEFVVVLFDRAASKLTAGTAVPIMSDRHRLADILDRFGAGLS